MMHQNTGMAKQPASFVAFVELTPEPSSMEHLVRIYWTLNNCAVYLMLVDPQWILKPALLPRALTYDSYGSLILIT